MQACNPLTKQMFLLRSEMLRPRLRNLNSNDQCLGPMLEMAGPVSRRIGSSGLTADITRASTTARCHNSYCMPPATHGTIEYKPSLVRALPKHVSDDCPVILLCMLHVLSAAGAAAATTKPPRRRILHRREPTTTATSTR